MGYLLDEGPLWDEGRDRVLGLGGLGEHDIWT